jgi:drug/metabolite transporter (DMT)-like permease
MGRMVALIPDDLIPEWPRSCAAGVGDRQPTLGHVDHFRSERVHPEAAGLGFPAPQVQRLDAATGIGGTAGRETPGVCVTFARAEVANMRPVTQSALFRLALLALIWGSSFLWIKLADRGFAPAEVTFGRLALGSAALFPVVAARREALPRSVVLWAQIALAALFANAIPYLLFAVAEQSVDSATAGIMLAAALPLSGAGAPQVSAASLASLVILGVLGTGVAYVLNYQIITSEGATVAATVTYLLPVVAIMLGVVVLGETVTIAALAGIALVLAGVALTRRLEQAPATDENGPAGPSK